jgi:hypothetical protein
MGSAEIQDPAKSFMWLEVTFAVRPNGGVQCRAARIATAMRAAVP